jgi:phytoene synthase
MMPGLQEAFSYCAELVRSGDRDRFIATLFAPASHRDALHALHAFAIEVARVRSLVREAVAGEIRLQWWREVVQRERGGEAKASPVAAALLDTIETYRLPSDPFSGLIEARRFDLYTEPMQTIAQLEDYAAKTSSVLFELAARTLGVGAAAAARPAGIAYAVAGLLTTLPRDAARGQLYLPLEVLERRGLGAKDACAGRSSASLNAAAADLRDLARRHLDKASQMLGDLPQPVLPVFLPAALVRHSLDRLERSDVLAPRVLPQWRRQWLLWRAARKANPLAN